MIAKCMNFFVKIICSILAFIIEPILVWLEKGVSIDDHKHNIKRLIIEIESFIKKNSTHDISEETHIFLYHIHRLISIFDDSVKPYFEKETYNILNYETTLLNKCKKEIIIEDNNLGSLILHLSTLHYEFNISNNSIIDKTFKKSFKKNVSIILEQASWSGSTKEVIAAQTISKLCFIGLSKEILDVGEASTIVSKLILTLPPNKWFYSGKVIYGTSFFLRSLLLICKTNSRDQIFDYTNKVGELLLRRMEIKKEKIFYFEKHLQRKESLIIEQMRFILAILEISSIFDDLRFLNAALKANDRMYSLLKELRITNQNTDNNSQQIFAAIHYLAGIKIQEKLYNTALCQS